MHPRPMRLPDKAVRCLAWFCLFLTLWPGFVVAADAPAPAAVPVVTNISGAVVVRSSGGVSRDILSSRIVHSGDTLVTGVDSIAMLSLADIGSIRLGPGSTATASATATSLGMSLDSGSLCAQAQTRAITVKAGLLSIIAGDETAIFSLLRTSDATTIAVYQGQISTTLSGKNAAVLHAGEAAVSTHDGNPVQVPIQTVQPSFAALKCPDDAIIAQAVPSAPPEPSGGGHGGGGGFIGILLGLGAIAALAGGHGGGGGSTAPPPTSPPTTGPGVLSVSPPNLSFLVGGETQSFVGSESGYGGPVNAISKNTAVATVSPSSGSGPSVTFTVTPIGAGTTSITVTDNHGGSRSVGITVTPPGTLMATPSTLTFPALGSANNQTFVATESSYTGVISVGGNNPSIATVSPSSGSSGQTFTVTPVGAGSTTINVTDDHGGSVPVSINVSPPGALMITPSTLAFDNSSVGSKQFTASETSYGGQIFSNDAACAGIATVSPSTGTGPSQIFTVSPVGTGGPCSIAVTDDHGGFQSLPVRVFGPPSVTPSTLTFTDVGLPNAQSIAVSETNPNYFGTFSIVSDTCAGTAAAGPPAGTGPSTTVPVFALASSASGGSCSFAVQDDTHLGTSTAVNVTVGPFGPVTPSKSSFTFADIGSGAAQPLTVSESGYTGTFSIDTGACAGVATVSPSTGSASTTFTITPVSAGGPCNINIRDDHTQSASVTTTVGPFGAITPTPTTLAFGDVGSGAAKTFTVTESGYAGTFSIDGSACAGIATVSPASGDSSTTFSVTPVAGGGPCSLSITDDHTSPAATVRVTVGPFGPLTPSPTTLTFSDVGAGANQSFNVSESGYTGAFTIDGSACAGVATVSPLSGPAGTFTVTPVGGGGPCNVVVSDDHTQTGIVSVTVGPFGSLVPSPTSFSFNVGDPNGTFTIAETGYTGNFTVDGSTCATNGVATVSPGTGTSATTFTVVPGASVGNCNIGLSDDHSGTQTVLVSLTSGGMSVSRATLFFTDTSAGPQDVTVFGPGSSEIDASTGDKHVADVSPNNQAGPGPAIFSIAPGKKTGTTSITFTDDAGGQAVVSVGVGVSPLLKKRHPLSIHKQLHRGTPVAGPSPLPRMHRPILGLPVGPISPRGIITEGGGSRAAGPTPTPPVSVRPTGVPPINPRPAPAPTPAPAPLNVSLANVTLTMGATAQPILVSEPGYPHLFSASSSNAAVATIGIATARGPMATFAILPRGLGVAVIRITDDHGGARTITVTVRAASAAPHLPPGIGRPGRPGAP